MSAEVVGAFSEEQVERLTGVSIAQLRRWDRTGFFSPSFKNEGVRVFSRIYSFRDLVSLRVLNQLRNVHHVSMPELRKAAERLAHLGEDVWTSTTLYVLRRRVVFDEPETAAKREVTTNQYVADIPLKVAISSTRDAIEKMNRRGRETVGKVVQNRYVQHRAPVLAGTRIPVRAIRAFHDAGYSIAAILREYPGLKPEDVKAAIEYAGAAAA